MLLRKKAVFQKGYLWVGGKRNIIRIIILTW